MADSISSSLTSSLTSALKTSFSNPPPTLSPGDSTYTVSKGDTLTSIAKENNKELNELIRDNPQIKDPNRIEVGDLIRIAGGAKSDDAKTVGAPSNPPADTFDTKPKTQTSTQVPAAPPTSDAAPGGPSVSDKAGAVISVTGAAANHAKKIPNPGKATKLLAKSSKGLSIAGPVLTGASQMLDSTTTTTAGTATNGTAAATGAMLYGAKHPVLAVADSVSGAFGGPSLSSMTNKGINTIVTIGEAAVTGDSRGLDKLNKDNLSGKNGGIMHMAAAYGDALAGNGTKALENYQNKARNGDYGTVAKTLARTGDYWAENGIIGGLKEFANNVRMNWSN